MTPEPVRVDVREDGTALVTLNRPDKHNALSAPVYAALRAALARLDADPGVRACVLTGAGDAFCAGGDIADFVTATDAAGEREVVRRAIDTYHQVERSDTVVIAAVNGGAFGGGLELTLACDIALASDRARFAFPEISLGVMPPFGLVRAPEVVGRGWTHWLTLSGEVVDAARALEIGLVQRVVPHDDLLEEANGLARRIAQHPPIALQVAKRMINRHAPAGVVEAIEATAMLLGTEDHKARADAFFGRR